MAAQKRIVWLDAAKGFAILLVVAGALLSGLLTVLLRNTRGAYQRVPVCNLLIACVTVTKQNADEVTGDAFVRTLKESGCKAVFYVEYVPVGGAGDTLAPDDGTRGRTAERVAVLREQYPEIVFLCFPGDERASGGCVLFAQKETVEQLLQNV